MNSHLLSSEHGPETCRICLQNDNQTDMISPCLCTGGSEFVHRKCLDHWRAMNKHGRAFKFCDVCQFEYVIEPVIDDPVAERKRLWKFRLLVTRDIIICILLVQVAITAMSLLVFVIDMKGNRIKHIYPASINACIVYYLSGLILSLTALGLYGLIAVCCGLGGTQNDDSFHYPCFTCFFIDCDSDCDCCNGNDSDDRCGIIVLLVIVLIFATLGVFVGIILGGIIIGQILERHKNKLWLRQEAKKYVVKDFQGRREELTNQSVSNPITESCIQIEINNNENYDKLSSACTV